MRKKTRAKKKRTANNLAESIKLATELARLATGIVDLAKAILTFLQGLGL